MAASRLAASLRDARLSRVMSVPQVQQALRLSGCTFSHREGVMTELQEISKGKLPLGTSAGVMLSVHPASERTLNSTWPSACTPALAHPGLAAASRVTSARNDHLSVDTSLGEQMLSHIGGYFNASRATVAVAIDSSWSELIHEMTHAAFHHRVRCGKGGPSDPLRTEWQALQDRGLSPRAAEELMCRHHELHALLAQGKRPWQRAATALLVIESALVDAINDIQSVPLRDRSAVQQRSLKRMTVLYLLVNSRARIIYLVLLGGVATALVGRALRYIGAVSKPAGRNGIGRKSVLLDRER